MNSLTSNMIGLYHNTLPNCLTYKRPAKYAIFIMIYLWIIFKFIQDYCGFEGVKRAHLRIQYHQTLRDITYTYFSTKIVLF